MICCKCSLEPKKMEMIFFKILTIFLGLLALTKSRPSQVMEGNNREISDADYESSDDSAADEYLHEDESTDEIPQNRNDVPERQEVDHNAKLLSGRYRSRNREGYETMSDKSRSERDRRREKISDLNTEDEKLYPSEKEHLKADFDPEEVEAEKSVSNSNNYKENRQLGDNTMRDKSLSSDYVGEPLFKTKQDEVNVDRSDYTNVAQESAEEAKVMKRYQNSFDIRNRGGRGRKNEHYFNNNRGRRQAPNTDATDVNSTPGEKEDIDLKTENSESSIIKNIKKLSERDLEELLNSLPEDKKAILKKIMEKREITKKAGAVEENFLEGGQSDTSKVEGYLVDSSTDSETSLSSSTDTTETDKHTESIDLDSTKNSDNENVSGKSDSKSQIYNTKEENFNRVETGNSNNDIKTDTNVNSNDESIKTDNKREINKIDYVNGYTESVISEKNNEDVDLKDPNDSSKDHDVLCLENEDWLDQKNDEAKTYSDTHKRDISPNNPPDVESSVKSLEESFPNDSNGETAMSPLIRVKRTEKDHCNNKRDINILSNVKVPFFQGVESEGTENDERSEIEDYGFFDRTSNYARSDQNIKEDKITYEASGINDKDSKLYQKKNSRREDINAEAGKACLGSDTDSVLSGVEGVDDNLMYNSAIRNKRTEEVSAMEINDGAQFSRIGRTAGPVDDSVNVVSENSINIPHYREEESFGPLSRNYEEDNGRFKRIRETKEAPISQEYSV